MGKLDLSDHPCKERNQQHAEDEGSICGGRQPNSLSPATHLHCDSVQEGKDAAPPQCWVSPSPALHLQPFSGWERGQSAILASMPASPGGLAGRRRLGCCSAGGGKTGTIHFRKAVLQQCAKGNFSCARKEEQRAPTSNQPSHATSLDCTYDFTRPMAKLPFSPSLILPYPNQLLRKGASRIFWHVDRWDDPISLLPPEAISALMLAPWEEGVTLLLCQLPGYALPSLWLFRKQENKPS